MQKLEIEETKYSPHILLDQKENSFFITGRSIPNNASEFYEPVLQWLKTYRESPNDTTLFEMHLEYFNTSTHKYLVEILKEISLIDAKKSIKWIYEEDDDDLLEIGNRLQSQLKLDFEFSAIEG